VYNLEATPYALYVHIVHTATEHVNIYYFNHIHNVNIPKAYKKIQILHNIQKMINGYVNERVCCQKIAAQKFASKNFCCRSDNVCDNILKIYAGILLRKPDKHI